MVFEPLEPLRIRVAGVVRCLQPGDRVTLTAEQGRKLLERAPHRVRVVDEDHASSLLGRTIIFESPLFGLLEAVVLDVHEHMVSITHPLMHAEASIPRSWIVQVRGEEAPSGHERTGRAP